MRAPGLSHRAQPALHAMIAQVTGGEECPLVMDLESRSCADACDADARRAAVLLSCFGYFEPECRHTDFHGLNSVLKYFRKEHCDRFLSMVGDTCKGCHHAEHCFAGNTIINSSRSPEIGDYER